MAYTDIYSAIGVVVLARERRRVNQLRGASKSLVMRLPSSWARAVGVGDHSEVIVAFGLGDLLLVAPAGSEAEILRLVRAAGGNP